MVKNIINALMPIKEATGLDIDIYSTLGDLLLSTGDTPEYTFELHKPDEFDNGILSDRVQKITYFLVSSPHNYIGVIFGCSEVSRNYAVMVTKIIESTFTIISDKGNLGNRMRMFLTGELNAVQSEALKNEYNSKFNYFVMALVTDSGQKQSELVNFLETMSDGDFVVKMDNRTIAYIRKCDKDDEYQSANDFAHVLFDNVKEELRINLVVSVGGAVHSFDRLPECYRHALYAFELGNIMDGGNSIYSYKDYMFVRMLSDVPKSTLKQYLEMLSDKGYEEVFNDDELLLTADEFLKNSLNISETSRNMYMHRNTLIYRLDKIEKATGLNIRHFNDAMTFRMIMILRKLTTRK